MNEVVVKTESAENGDIVIPIPAEILEKLGWSEGTILTASMCNGGIKLERK